ncbi:MAG TPA: hypothetical protein VFP69_09575 [Streptomyces sp.]|nr:hypothetical protein [Streptomyces sp.]
MTGQEPGSDRTPPEGHGAAPVPDEVWQMFLKDSESAIRRSAPRERSALERVVLAGRQRPESDGVFVSVGELWQPEDRWGGPAWRDMDAGARLRRVARAVGALAVLGLLFGALFLLPAGSGNPYRPPGGTVSEQSGEAPEELPTTTATAVPKAAFSPDGT